MRKILLGLFTLLFLFWGCNNENDQLPTQSTKGPETGTKALSRTTSSGLSIDNSILFLQADTVNCAGHIAITANVPELTLEWNVQEETNLDTTQTNIDVVDGRATLDIKWAKRLPNGGFAPGATAFINGVRVSDGTTSLYVHLILTTDPLIEDFDYLLDYPNSVTPDASLIQITPQEVNMTESEGGAAEILLLGTAPIQMQMERIGSFTKIDMSLIPESVEDNGTAQIPFKWKTAAPDANFKAIYYAYSYDTNLKAEAVVSYTKQGDAFLTVTPDSIQFLDAGGTLSTKIETNQDKWVLQNTESIPEWLTCSETEGNKGTSTLNLIAASNPSTDSRSCLLKVSAGTITQEISVKQLGFKPELNVSFPSFSEIKAEGEEVSVNVVSNVEWELSGSMPEWLHSDITSGSGNGAILFTVDPLNSFEGRTAKVTIVSKTITPSISREITFTQNSRTFKVSPPVFPNINMNGESLNVTVTSNVDWQVSEDRPAWIHPTMQSGSGNGTIIFNIDANNTSENRTAIVKILTLTGETEVSREITFTQNHPIFDVSPLSFPNINPEGENMNVSVSSNVNWKVSEDIPSWLHPSVNSGSNNGNIMFAADPNYTATVRTASVKIFTTIGGTEVSKIVTFTQQDIKLEITPESYPEISESGEKLDVRVTSNVNWRIEGNVAGWLHANITSGTGNGTVRFTVDANNTFVSRQTTVVISTTIGTEVIRREVIFTQKASEPRLTVSKAVFTDISKSGITLSTKLSTNMSWKVLNSNNWIQVIPSNGSGDRTLSIRVASNNKNSARTGTITVQSTNAGKVLTATITIGQKGNSMNGNHEGFDDL